MGYLALINFYSIYPTLVAKHAMGKHDCRPKFNPFYYDYFLNIHKFNCKRLILLISILFAERLVFSLRAFALCYLFGITQNDWTLAASCGKVSCYMYNVMIILSYHYLCIIIGCYCCCRFSVYRICNIAIAGMSICRATEEKTHRWVIAFKSISLRKICICM